MKFGKNIFHVNGNERKKAGVVTFISNKIDFKTKAVNRYKTDFKTKAVNRYIGEETRRQSGRTQAQLLSRKKRKLQLMAEQLSIK